MSDNVFDIIKKIMEKSLAQIEKENSMDTEELAAFKRQINKAKAISNLQRYFDEGDKLFLYHSLVYSLDAVSDFRIRKKIIDFLEV